MSYDQLDAARGLQDESTAAPSLPIPSPDSGLPSPVGIASDRELPQICLTLKRLPEAVAEAERALRAIDARHRLFDHEGRLVELRRGGGDAGRARLVSVELTDLQCLLTYAARWFEETEKGPKPIFPPPLLVRDLLRRAAEWATPLSDLVNVPVFGEGWTLLADPGYHGGSNSVYYDPHHAPLPPVPPAPSVGEVDQARRLLCEELLGDFPFVDASDLAVAVAAILVPFVRRRIDGATPLHLVDAPQAGSGKTLLADVVALPALGREPAATTEIANGDDLRKWVTAMSVAGEPVILIDNVNARLGGAALAAALTKVAWSDRIVGTSKLASGTLRGLWLATGNNVTMTHELARRVVRCRIDAGVERPFLRDGFRHADLRAWAKAQRPRLIHAALTLVTNWVARGRPAGSVTLGSYESYASVIGGILEAAGISGFLANLAADQRRADDQTIEWSAFVTAWRERFGAAEVGTEELARDVLGLSAEMLGTSLGSAQSPHGRRVKLGQELRKRGDVVIDGWRIKVSDGVDRHGRWRYRLEGPAGAGPSAMRADVPSEDGDDYQSSRHRESR